MITVTNEPAGTRVKVDGWLTGDGVAELGRVVDAAAPTSLLLHDLRGADAGGLSLLRRLAARAWPSQGLSTYIQLMLANRGSVGSARVALSHSSGNTSQEQRNMSLWKQLAAGAVSALAVLAAAASTHAQPAGQSGPTAEARPPPLKLRRRQASRQPNILVIWGDDIGQFNISAYNNGMMGYRTPNIDSIARDGALFTDWYGQQSCTAGRAAFVTGQSPIRTGLTKVGLPGAPEGMKAEDPTIATLLRAQGYVTGQFGKNHLGDRDEMLPSKHGFDEFFGNLYHLNAEEEPEHPDYPKDPEFKKKFGPRGVIHSFADGRITDTGPLTRKRMETIDEEVTAKALDFMTRASKADKPFFLWWNSTRMHVFTHLKAESEGKTGLGIYADGMVGARRPRGPGARQAQGAGPRPRTPSSCTPPTTAPRRSRGPMAARRCSAARRTRTGRAATASPP